jgi:RNA 2',3'-cyclic 3'-phosphodiesterase
MIRAFIAIDIPDDVRATIEDAQTRLRETSFGVKVSWTRIANLHLTLQFLGNIEQGVVGEFKKALESVAAQHQPFEISVRGGGAFPNENRPRVVWVGCEDNGDRLKTLALAVHDAMQPFGFTQEHRGFAAHLTIGRIKLPRPDVALTRAVKSLKDTAFGALRVEAIHLFESQLHPEGSIYTKLSSHALGAHNQ